MKAWHGAILLVAVTTILFVYSMRGTVSYNHPHVSLDFNGHLIDAEVVSDAKDIQQGLSDRVSMDREKGMLFEMGVRQIHSFWMQRMHFPLDIIWIDGNRVVEIAPNVPSPGFLEVPVTYTPKAEANRVLEVNAGIVQETGLKVGDKIGGLTGE